MVRFYKPEKLDVPIFTRKEDRTTGPDDSPDVTEEVLERLRPCLKKPKEWTKALQEIDDEGYRPQLIFIDTGLVTQLNATNRANFGVASRMLSLTQKFSPSECNILSSE
jgi:aarF domain-containing kinase